MLTLYKNKINIVSNFKVKSYLEIKLRIKLIMAKTSGEKAAQ